MQAMRRSSCIGAAVILSALALAGMSAPAKAQDWPVRPVKFILTLGPGSGADLGARLLAEKLSAKWGHPVVVENRPGGDGFVAINAFTSARDDHMLLFGPASSFTAHPYLHARLPYDPRDLAPVARVSSTLVSIGAPPSGPGSLKEIFAKARAEPGKLNWASTTGATDLIINAFFKTSGVDMTRIPYRDGVQAQTDVAEGRLQPLLVGLCDRARAGARRADQGCRGHGNRADRHPARHADGDAGGLPGADLRRPRRHVRPARHAAACCASGSPPTSRQRSPIPSSCSG